MIKNLDKNLNKYFNSKIENILNQPTNNISTDLIELDNKFDDFKFITDEDILSSFDKVFKDYIHQVLNLRIFM